MTKIAAEKATVEGLAKNITLGNVQDYLLERKARR
jgi:hypothetical protein